MHLRYPEGKEGREGGGGEGGGGGGEEGRIPNMTLERTKMPVVRCAYFTILPTGPWLPASCTMCAIYLIYTCTVLHN